MVVVAIIERMRMADKDNGVGPTNGIYNGVYNYGSKLLIMC